MARLEQWETDNVAERIWARDSSLWSASGAPPDAIVDRLGWLDLPESMRGRIDEVRQLAQDAQRDGYTQVAVLGMGGSSLAPELFGRVFGASSRSRATDGATDGAPRLALRVLDSTHPDAVREFRAWAASAPTIFIVSSKSGTTTEPLAFHAAMAQAGPPESFIAITDPGTPLEDQARREGFRAVIPAPADVGGRYSALTTFGLVPAAFVGVDLPGLLDRAAEMAQRCRQPARENPGLRLAAAIGEAALAGRDKLTLLVTEQLTSFGDWVEQLIAESTGKLGRGVVPVVGERIAEPASYGDDRYFVMMRMKNENQEPWQGFSMALTALGHPGHDIKLRDPLDIGGEFFRWEFATAALGIVLGIDPFDQPNVQESKDATTTLLDAYRAQGALPDPDPLVDDGDIRVYGDEATLAGRAKTSAAAVRQLFAAVRPGDYLALLAYLPPEPAVRDTLDSIRTLARDRLGVATTLGFGPRFLHSTGQLHKGGPASGVFLQLTADPAADEPIPDWSESFATLVAAQALGDLESLQRRGRRALRVHVRDLATGLAEVERIATEALGKETATDEDADADAGGGEE